MELFYKNAEGLWNVAACGTVFYLALFTFIRLSGKRTMSKLNAFDFVVAVTLGSTLSSMILAKTPVLVRALAMGVIVGFQYLLAKMARDSPAMEKMINSRPTLLFYNGLFLDETLERECVTEEEIHAAVRAFRMEDMDWVRAVIMELNRELTVVRKGGSHRTLLSRRSRSIALAPSAHLSPLLLQKLSTTTSALSPGPR